MVACDCCTRLGLPCVYSRAGRACNNCQDSKRRCSAFTPKSDSSCKHCDLQSYPPPSGSQSSRAERFPSIILVSSCTKWPSAHGEDLMTPPPVRNELPNTKDYVRKAREWASKNGVNQPLFNKHLKRPQAPLLSSAAGPSTTHLKQPLEDPLEQSPKRLANRLSACPRNPAPIILSPKPTFPQAPGHQDGTKKTVPYPFRFAPNHAACQDNGSPIRPRLLDSYVGLHKPAFSAGQYRSRGALTPCSPTRYRPSRIVGSRLSTSAPSRRDTFPDNPLWEEAIFPATTMLEYVGAFRNMYCDLLHLAAVTPAQRRRRYATFLVGIHQLAKQLELAVIVSANKCTRQA
ncbi:hypothetical protein PTTG_26259 [Puccinia triticina 1-1 BBBD Race 1]|uniref:Uncharacterized protein n=1 Tax=Puccinia triticina (isolate 1-1 / race 1 (BBBD)) TaxID=630390 RepID=A0A180GWC5_PUCT1|nr:hypothetical protein PTTG_26259 [Puccinia triticina 1-1 BBBD Race 1]